MHESVMSRLNRVFIGVVLLSLWTLSFANGQTWNPLDTTPGTVPGSALDLSSLTDAPAGQYGFIGADSDGDLQFANLPGQKIRFYGANISGDAGMTSTQANALANRMSALGYNLARVTGHDCMESWAMGIFNTPTSLDPNLLSFNTTRLDSLEYLFSQLRAKGIYLQVDLFTLFSFKSIPELAAFDTDASYLVQLDSRAYALWQKAVTLYLTHVNPYTGLSLLNDPMVIGVSPWNESLLLNLHNPNATFSTTLLTQYNAFLATKSISPVTSFPITSTAQNASTDCYWEMNATNSGLLMEFFTQKTTGTYAAMKTYLQDTLGLQAILGGLNFINSPVVNYWRSVVAEAHETHLYYQWDTATVTPGSGIYYYNPTSYRRLSELFTVDDNHTANAYPAVSLYQPYRSPVFLTEFHDVFPNPGREQAGIFAAACGAFQGWDQLSRFTLGQRAVSATSNYKVGAFNEFEVAADPLALLSEYQGVLAFRTGYMKAAAPRFVIVRDKTYCKSNVAASWDGSGTKNLTYLSFLYNTQTVYADTPSTPLTVYKITAGLNPTDIAAGILPPANKVSLSSTMSRLQVAQACVSMLDSADSTELAIKTMQQNGLNANKLVSETGEMVFDLTNTRLSIDTACLAAAAGTQNSAVLTFTQSGLTLQSTMTNGTLFAASLDKKPVRQSAHLLVMNTTDVKATGATQVTQTDSSILYTIPNPGNAPDASNPNLVLYATGSMTFSTTLNPFAFTAYRIGMNGARLATIPLLVNGSQLSMSLDTTAGCAFEVVSAPTFSDSDIGSPSLAGSATYNTFADTYKVTGSGADIWGTADQFNYYSRTVSGNSIVAIARLTNISGAQAWAKSGLMFRDSTASGSLYAAVEVTPWAGVDFQWRSTTNDVAWSAGNIASVAAPTPANPVWVKLAKNGNSYSAYYATGTASPTVWNQIGSAQTINFSSTPRLGLAATSHDNTALSTVTFDNVNITQLPILSSADIGSPLPAGSMSCTNTYNEATATYTVNGGGTDIWDASDKFQFASQTLTGTSATAIVRVTSLSNTNSWSKTGLMFRDSSAAGSIFADVLITPSNGLVFQWRATTNGTATGATVTTVPAPTASNPVWLKLVKSGSNISAYYATGTATPSSWTQVSTTRTVTFSGNSCLAGLALTSHAWGSLCTATLDNLSLTGN